MDDEAAQRRRQEEDDLEAVDLSTLQEHERAEMADKLKFQAELKAKKVRHKVAENLELREGGHRFVKGHLVSPTCCVIAPDELTACSGGRDCAIIRWDVETGAKTIYSGTRRDTPSDADGHSHYVGHEVKGVAYTRSDGDGGCLISVGNDRTVRFWDLRADPRSANVHTVKGQHQGAINGVVCAPELERFYTISADKSLRSWILYHDDQKGDSGRALDSQYGHTAAPLCLDMLVGDRPISAGADSTARYWKVQNESHLLFQHAGTHSSPIDAVALLDTDHFCTGAQDGKIALWHTQAKRPGAVRVAAHGRDPWEGGHNRWVSALAGMKCTDTLFSGSKDGVVKVWRVGINRNAATSTEDHKNVGKRKDKWTIDPVNQIPVPHGGWVNQISVSRSGKLMVAAIGREQREGRWDAQKTAKNGLLFQSLSHSAGKLY